MNAPGDPPRRCRPSPAAAAGASDLAALQALVELLQLNAAFELAGAAIERECDGPNGSVGIIPTPVANSRR